MKKQSLFFVPGIILIGVSLRTPFTVLPIILGDISQGLGVEVSSLGVLTSLPLLMFTLFSLFSTRLAQKIGLEHLFTDVAARRASPLCCSLLSCRSSLLQYFHY